MNEYVFKSFNYLRIVNSEYSVLSIVFSFLKSQRSTRERRDPTCDNQCLTVLIFDSSPWATPITVPREVFFTHPDTLLF